MHERAGGIVEAERVEQPRELPVRRLATVLEAQCAQDLLEPRGVATCHEQIEVALRPLRAGDGLVALPVAVGDARGAERLAQRDDETDTPAGVLRRWRRVDGG
jgi:hypothetical protein